MVCASVLEVHLTTSLLFLIDTPVSDFSNDLNTFLDRDAITDGDQGRQHTRPNGWTPSFWSLCFDLVSLDRVHTSVQPDVLYQGCAVNDEYSDDNTRPLACMKNLSVCDPRSRIYRDDYLLVTKASQALSMRLFLDKKSVRSISCCAPRKQVPTATEPRLDAR